MMASGREGEGPSVEVSLLLNDSGFLQGTNLESLARRALFLERLRFPLSLMVLSRAGGGGFSTGHFDSFSRSSVSSNCPCQSSIDEGLGEGFVG